MIHLFQNIQVVQAIVEGYAFKWKKYHLALSLTVTSSLQFMQGPLIY